MSSFSLTRNTQLLNILGPKAFLKLIEIMEPPARFNSLENPTNPPATQPFTTSGKVFTPAKLVNTPVGPQLWNAKLPESIDRNISQGTESPFLTPLNPENALT